MPLWKKSIIKEPRNCPKRQLPPAPLTEMPFPASSENLSRLKDFLLDKFASSTFNTCENQPLSLMETPPMKLMVDLEAEHIAYHTPIPVPFTGMRQSKLDLIRMFALENGRLCKVKRRTP